MPDNDKPNPARELGKRRIAKLTPEQRSELGRKAANARWPKPPERCPNTFRASQHQDVAHCELTIDHVGECVWDNKRYP